MPHDPTLFLGTAPYYARFRPAYPAELFAQLRSFYGLSRASRVLDLGCGPGLLALPLATEVGEVWAADPDAGMLAEVQAGAVRAGLGNVHTLHSTAEEVPASLGPLDLVTIGDAFRWMDRAAVLKRVHGLLAPGGGVAVIGNRSMYGDTGGAEVQAAIRSTLHEFLGPQRRAGQGVYVHPAQTHEEVICASVFDGFQTWRLAWEERWPVARVVGFQHSASFATPHLLGGRLDEFDRVLTGRLRAVAPGGQIAVEREVTALLLGG